MDIENKKKIANFMGCKIIKEYSNGFMFVHPNKTRWEWSNQFQDNLEVDTFFSTDSFYDNDWNWLMEVVENIENLKPIEFLSGRNWIGFDIRIYKIFNTQTNCCTIKYLKESGDMTISNSFSKKTKIEAVSNACLDFIKWYNEQNK